RFHSVTTPASSSAIIAWSRMRSSSSLASPSRVCSFRTAAPPVVQHPADPPPAAHPPALATIPGRLEGCEAPASPLARVCAAGSAVPRPPAPLQHAGSVVECAPNHVSRDNFAHQLAAVPIGVAAPGRQGAGHVGEHAHPCHAALGPDPRQQGTVLQ